MASRLIEAQKWVMNVRNILSKVEDCLHCRDNHIKKVSLCEIEELLFLDPLPCSETGHAKLKVDKV